MFNNHRFLYEADAPIASPAAAMAALSVEANPEATTPTEIKTQTEATPATPAKTAEPAQPVADAKVEPQTPAADAAPTAEKPWQEVLKSQQPEAIFKELGLDDKTVKLAQRLVNLDPKVIGLIDTWENKGNVKDYLEALSVDYTKMDPQEVMKNNLRSQFPDMPAEDFNDLFDVKVIERYKLDPERFTADEVRRGKIELAADSKSIKDALISKQQERLLPASPEAKVDPRIAAMEAQQTQQAQNISDYKKRLTEDPYIKSVIANKKITIGEGAEAFNYTVAEPEKALSFWHDSKAISASMNTEGKEDFQKQTLIGAFAADPYGFIKQMATHFKGLGAKDFVDPIENASGANPSPAKSEAQPKTAAEALAQNGQWRSR